MSNRARAAGVVVALVTAFCAQALFSAQVLGFRLPAGWGLDQRTALGCLLLLVAAAVFAWSTSGGPSTAPENPAPGGVSGVDRPKSSPRGKRIGAAGFVLVAALYLASLALYLARGEDTLVRFLWLAAVGLLVSTQLIALALEGRSGDRRVRVGWPPWWEWLAVALVTAMAAALRVWALTDIPSNVHGDVASIGLQALAVLQNPRVPWFSNGWTDTPMVEYVGLAWGMRLFGESYLGLALTGAIQGTLTVVALYCLVKEVAGRRAAVVAAVLLAVSYTHIQFARTAINITVPLTATVMLWLFFRAVRTGKTAWFVLSGVTLGVGLMGYYSIRLAPVVLLLVCLWMLLWQRQMLLASGRGLLALAMAALVGYGPMLAYSLSHLDELVGRASIVTLVNPQVVTHLLAKYHVDSLGPLLLEQSKRTFLTFHLYADSSTHFSFPGPMVDAFTACLLVLGFGYALARLRRPQHMALVSLVVLTLLLGGVASNDPPFWPHFTIILPAICALAALGAERAWATLARPLGQRGTALVGILLFAALAMTGARNWESYYAHVRDNAEPQVRLARYASRLPEGTQVVLVTDPFSWRQRELQFLARGVPGRDIAEADVRAGALVLPAAPAVVILSSNHADLLPALRSDYPGGELETHKDQTGSTAFLAYSLNRPVAQPGAGAPEGGTGQALPAELALGLLAVGILAGFLAGLAAGRLWRSPRPADPRAAAEASSPPQTSDAAVPEVAAGRRAWPSAASLRSLGLRAWTAVSLLYRRLPASAPPPVAPSDQASPEAPLGPALPPAAVQAPLPRRKALLLLLGLAVSLLLACLGQSFFDGPGNAIASWLLSGRVWSEAERLAAGGASYLAAMIVFALAAPASLAPPRPTGQAGPLRWMWSGALPSSRPRLLVLVGSLAIYLVSMLRFGLQGEDGAVRWLWAIALVLFVAAYLPWPVRRQAAHPEGEPSPGFTPAKVALLAAILGVGFWLRFEQLAVIPSDFHGDMASYGLQARQILLGLETRLFHEGWANIPLLGFVPSALSMQLFGNDLVGLNLTAVAGGVLTLAGLYLLVWRLFDGHRLAALATGVLAINTAHIHFSRIAAYMDPWPFSVFALFLVVDGLKSRRKLSFALAGVLLGFATQMYYSGRVVLVILAAFVLYEFLFRRRRLCGNAGHLVLVAAGFLAAFGPSLIYFARNWDVLMERSRDILIFNPPVMVHSLAKYGTDSPAVVIWEQVKRSLLIFNYSIDSSTQFGYPHPMFSSLISPLVALGCAAALRRWRQPGPGLAVLWLGLTMVTGSILTDNAPFWPRLVGLMIIGALLAAVALHQVWSAIEKAARSFLPAQGSARPAWMPGLFVSAAAGIAIVGLLCFAGWQDWNLYYQTVRDNARPQARIGRFLAGLSSEVAACNFSNPYELRTRETAFLAWPRVLLDLPPDTPDAQLSRCPGPPFVWILHPNYLARLAALRDRWSGGIAQEHRAADGTLLFVSYLVAPGAAGTGAGPQPRATQVPAAPDAASSGLGSSAYNPDGTLFAPIATFLGDATSTTWAINVAQVTVTGGRLTVRVGPVAGHDAAYDYVRLVAPDGRELRFEAEDATITMGDAFAPRDGLDGHWWLQTYGPYSSHQGLVAQKGERVPMLTTSIQVPDGAYTLYIGSFKGDRNNGVFGLAVRWE